MTTLIEFLHARLDEDEAVVRRNLGRSGIGDDGNFPDYRTYDGPDLEAADDYLYHFRPTRELAEVAAKRTIIADCTEMVKMCQVGPDGNLGRPGEHMMGDFGRWILQKMAAPYADHPDFDPAWQPAEVTT
jgi:hypothetical protein